SWPATPRRVREASCSGSALQLLFYHCVADLFVKKRKQPLTDAAKRRERQIVVLAAAGRVLFYGFYEAFSESFRRQAGALQGRENAFHLQLIVVHVHRFRDAVAEHEDGV